MSLCKSQDKDIYLWRSSKFIPRVLGLLVSIDIAASIAVPEHDSIRFMGKYLLLVLAIKLTHSRATDKIRSASLKWWAVFVAFIAWTLGFSMNYLSECLYGEIKPIYEYLHNAIYLVKMLVFIWAVLLPERESERIIDLYCRWSSMLLLVCVYLFEMVFCINHGINVRSSAFDLFDLTDKYSFILLLATILLIKIVTVSQRNMRVLYGGLLSCVAARAIVESNKLAGVFIRFSHSSVLWDIAVADLPVLLFVIVVYLDIDLADRWKVSIDNLANENISSSLSVLLPIMTGVMALLLWRKYPQLVTASSIGITCILMYCIQSLVRQIYSQRQLTQVSQERALLERTLQEDVVTGIYSRRWFDEVITLGCQDASEGKPSIVIFMIDVDNFKGYNDTLGHKAGDYCLKAVASALRSALGRERDAVARYGGDEMAAILFQSDAEGAMAVAERMRRAVWELNVFHPKNSHKRVTVSIGIGIAGTKPGLITPTDLLLAADAALYESKAHGKNTVRLRATGTSPDIATTAIVPGGVPPEASTSAPRLLRDA